MRYQKISIGIILFGGEKYIPYSIKSLLELEYPGEHEILLLDYGPNFSAEKFVRKLFPEKKNIRFFRSEKTWHSGGHNILINNMTGTHYICASNDMLYSKDMLTKIAEGLHKNPEYSVATGKILQWDFEKNKKTTKIDSLGIGITKTQHFFDISQGKTDPDEDKKYREIFGASGALIVLSKKALISIQYISSKGKREYFDELLHYKNDVDLAYRLQWAEEKCLLIGDALFWHHRQCKKNSGNLLRRRQKTKKSIRENSFFGHLIVLKKNIWKRGFSFSVYIRVFFALLLKNIYILFCEPSLMLQWKKVHVQKKEIERKRKKMTIKNSAKNISKFWKNPSSI